MESLDELVIFPSHVADIPPMLPIDEIVRERVPDDIDPFLLQAEKNSIAIKGRPLNKKKNVDLLQFMVCGLDKVKIHFLIGCLSGDFFPAEARKPFF